jgi:ElaB/YqjD/DUF883 family membrane-anchored ribosome-binding protein
MENETTQAEVIRQQMEDTRTALTEKLETLEEQVAAKIQGTTDSVVETVETVKEAVEKTVGTVSDTVDRTVDTVKEAFDLQHHVEEHPWLVLGGAVLLGYVGGRLLDRMAPPVRSNGHGSNGHGSQAPYIPGAPTYFREPAPPAKPGYGAEVVEALKPAMSKLGQLAIGVTTGIIGEMIREQLPEALQKDVGEVFDDVTRSLGGKPLHGFMAHESSERG